MKKENVLLGLKRASWLFGLIGTLIAAFFIKVEEYADWDEPDEYLFQSIVVGAIIFGLFRIGIWVFKAFAGVPTNVFTRKCCLSVLKKISICQRSLYIAAIVVEPKAR